MFLTCEIKITFSLIILLRFCFGISALPTCVCSSVAVLLENSVSGKRFSSLLKDWRVQKFKNSRNWRIWRKTLAATPTTTPLPTTTVTVIPWVWVTDCTVWGAPTSEMGSTSLPSWPDRHRSVLRVTGQTVKLLFNTPSHTAEHLTVSVPLLLCYPLMFCPDIR